MRAGELIRVLAGRQGVDLSSAAGRAADRHRRIAWSGLANGVSTFVTLAVGLISLPLTVHYLGAERYGLWVAIGSWISLLAVTDLGIGNGLVSLLAEANGQDDREAARRHLSTAAALLTVVALALGGVFALGSQFISWPGLLNATTAEAAAEAGPTVAIVVLFFLLNLPVGLVGRVYAAYQEGYVLYLWQIGGSLASLAGVVLATQLRLGLPFLAFSILFARFVVSLANLTCLLYRAKPWIRPSWRLIDRVSASRLMGVGLLFALANVGLLLELQAPYIVGPHAVGLRALGEFGVAHRLFNLAATVPLMFLAPLWPAYGEALARRDLGWVQRTLSRTYRYGLGISVPLALLLIGSGGVLIRLWISRSYEPDIWLLALLGLWMIARVWRETHANCLNGANRILGQATYGGASGLLGMGLAYELGLRFGNHGLVAGWVLGFVLLSGWLLPLDVRHLLRKRVADAASS